MTLCKEPLVSIVVPNLNYCEFLAERFSSIVEQTYRNCEVIIIDGFSADDSWQFICDFDFAPYSVIREQRPPKGVYDAINYAIKKSSGEYIYIATSDDTMHSTCIEKMVAVLERYSFCDICHANMLGLDKDGNSLEDYRASKPSTLFFDDLNNVPHIRLAPLDGLLHCTLHVVYGSLTQLLLRRNVFTDKAGYFRLQWQHRGDFEWGMRAGLSCNVVHIPEALATWRIHGKQLTQGTDGTILCDMLNSGLIEMKKSYPKLYSKLNKKKLQSYYRRIELSQVNGSANNIIKKIMVTLFFIFLNPLTVYDAATKLIQKKAFIDPSDNINYLKKTINRLFILDPIIRLKKY